MEKDPIFGFEVPKEVAGVPSELLSPKDTWEDRQAYERQAEKLARLFIDNFMQYSELAPKRVSLAGPKC